MSTATLCASPDLRRQRPRVLQVITHLALGGAERVALNLMRGLREQFEFALFAANGVEHSQIGVAMKAELDEMEIPLFVGTNAPIKFGGMLLAGIRSAKAVHSLHPDLIHLHTEIPESSHATMLWLHPSMTKIPIVRTVHNTIYWHPWRKVGRWCDRHLAQSFVACVSAGAAEAFEELRAESGAGPLPQPPVIIHNGVDLQPQPRPTNRPSDRIRILFAGRFEDQKGVDLLPEILKQVHVPPGQICELVIYGAGTHEAALQTLASNPPQGWIIRLLSPVPDLAGKMSEFDLVIMPSRYEGLAMVAIEAAMLGVPVVATDAPGLRESFPPDYPWLARAGDADSFANVLQHALDNPQSWPTVGQQAHEFAKAHFGVAGMCEEYRKLYAKALAASESIGAYAPEIEAEPQPSFFYK
jgi:glycosyltransferase involved in cell wall biosynthesis